MTAPQMTPQEWDRQLQLMMSGAVDGQRHDQDAAWAIVSAQLGPRPPEAPAAQLPPWQQPNGQNGPPPSASGSVRGPRGRPEFFVFWKNGDIDLGETLARLPRNDQDAAALIAREWCPGELHYVPGPRNGTWHVWDGTCHRPDSDSQAAKRVAEFAETVQQALVQCRQAVNSTVALEMLPGATKADVDKEAERRWAKDWKTTVGYAAGVKKAAGARALLYSLSVPCSVDGRVFDDHHPRLLNCLNGTVSLETGKIRPHDPADMIAYCVPAEYRQDVPPPQRFWDLLSRAVGYDREVTYYLARALGYCLLGENPEKLIFFISGPEDSGKTQVLHIVSQVIGRQLAHPAKAGLITVQHNGRHPRHEFSVRGKRLVTITETSVRMQIDEGQVKILTGEREISVDPLYAREQDTIPVTFTPFVATNEMPTVPNLDGAMARRVVVMPGGPPIPLPEQNPRISEEILEAEREQILALLVRECVGYHRHGLAQPAAVTTATASYRGEQDHVADFIAELCDRPPEGHPPDSTWYTEMAETWVLHREWAKNRFRGEIPYGKQTFYRYVAEQPGVLRQDNGGSIRRFYGLRWNQRAKTMLL